MSASRQRWRVLIAGCACLAATHLRVSAEEKPAEVPPEITAKCTEFLDKVNALRRKDLDKTMADEIAAVAKATGLGPEGVKTLEAAAVTAEDAAQADLSAKALEMYTKEYAKAGGRGVSDLSRPDIIEKTARPDSGFDSAVHYTRPLDQPAWKEALARALSPEQAAAWQKAQDARNEAVPKELDEMLDRQADQMRNSTGNPLATRCAEIIGVLDLTPERVATVNALAKQATEASMDAWRKEAHKTYLSKDEATRKRLLRGRQFYAPVREDNAPENQAVWTEGIAKLLTDDERKILASARGDQRKRRTHALAMLMVSLLDEKVAFTADQRPKLEPIVERLVQKNEEFYPQSERNNEYFNLNATAFYKAAVAAKAEEIRPILDDLQWKRWQDTGHDKGEQDDEDENQPAASPTPGGSPAAIEEPEDLEALVSEYMATKTASEHKRVDAVMLLQAEDAARVASLPPATAARLRTAARGAAEAALADWSSSMEETVRGQVQGAEREMIQQRLSNSNRYYFTPPTPKDQAVWKQAIKTDLTQAQQDAWQVERDARARYADDAVAQFLLAEFDRNFILGAGQWERFAPLIAKALHDYRPDINRMFSYNSSQWFLTSYYMFLPVHAIPEEDCKAIVGKERFERWTGSNGYRYSVQYWSNLKEYHEERMKEEKK